MEKTRVRVGRNIRHFRLKRNLTQLQLAKLSKIPKSTLNHVEAGISAPSIEVVESIASGLGISIEELISAGHATVQIKNKKSMQLLNSTSGSVLMRILPDPFSGIDFYYCELNRMVTLRGSIQNPHGKKMIFCVNGKIQLRIGEETHIIEPGGSAIFPGEIPHSFTNVGTAKAQFIKVHYYGSSQK